MIGRAVWKTLAMRFEVGEPVRVEFSKWDGGPHWAYSGSYLGADRHGDWIGHPAGTLMARPGRSFIDTAAWLTLVPANGAAWLGTFNTPEHHLGIYIDLTTPPTWHDGKLEMIDMDLDVVVPRDDREPFIDDQDEFAEHTIAYGYPDDVVALIQTTATELLAAVIDRRPPFDGTAEHWLDELARISG